MSTAKHPVLAMILKGYPRISETFISNEIRLLEQRGVKIHIISMRKPREDFTHKSISEIKAEVSYLPSSIEGCLEGLFGSTDMNAGLKDPRYGQDSEFTDRIDKIWKVYKDTGSEASFKHMLQAEFIVQKVLPGSEIFHFHAHFAHSPCSVARNVSRLSGLPFSFTAHAKDIYTQKPEKVTAKISEAKFAVTCTGYNCNYLESIAPAGKPIHKVYHGIDLNLFSSDKEFTSGAPYEIFTVARFTPKKGLPTVFKALKKLDDRGIDFSYKIVGDGDDRESTLAILDELGIADKCTWLGTKTHEEVLELYRKADLFAIGCEIAENGDRDGIPNVLAESMAMSVPVVATTVSGIPELVEHGKTGLLVEPRDHESMADAMEKMLTDQEFRKSVIPAAKERVHEIFDNRYWINKLADVYEIYGIKAGR
ncbi:glycosyltransferase family 4 protein [Maridesulfovibrio hydrothermalis]|uniref:Glycosyl transferase group 1 n=1 Tax=Maridesulfovibrio hydrothermalis AM13 = DSM 14728 TaxID=1121451 RepID=L0RD38_9BACT|nr:glycosyltransferase family 4 protein [Maridesulfovibrio hydrothermalis]CCO24698.1 Glycosyl transferase group 1 [Maridesulfovibrio hydrothermalis AM13 = DSM 14728]